MGGSKFLFKNAINKTLLEHKDTLIENGKMITQLLLIKTKYNVIIQFYNKKKPDMEILGVNGDNRNCFEV